MNNLRIIVLLVFCSAPLQANGFWDNFSWSAGGSMLWFPEDHGKQGSDPAALFPSLGAAASYRVFGLLALELTEDLYFTNYEYNFSRNYPMACDYPQRSAFVFGFFTGLQIAGHIPLDGGAVLRVYGGPAADIRIVTLAQGLLPDERPGDADAPKQTSAIRDYFWNNGRWFMPVLGAGVDFPINEKFLLGFDLRMWLPVYRLWTGGDIPPVEGWRFSAGFRITPRKMNGS